jgi:hypothetical protein
MAVKGVQSWLTGHIGGVCAVHEAGLANVGKTCRKATLVKELELRGSVVLD